MARAAARAAETQLALSRVSVAAAAAERVRAERAAVRNRHRAAERTTAAEVSKDTRAAAMVQANKVCRRVAIGAVTPVVGLKLLERLASGLDAVTYDRAVDSVAGRFAPGDTAEVAPWRLARGKGGGTDAETRRARARSQKCLRAGGTAEVHNVTAAGLSLAAAEGAGRYPHGGDWSAPLPAVADPMGGAVAGPVFNLRPVWAVGTDGTVADAADQFATAYAPTFGATARSTRATGHYARRNARTGQLGRGLERTTAAPWLGEYRESGPVATARDIGPESPWRVADMGCVDTANLRARAAARRAEGHDYRLRAEHRAEDYRRNGWNHGGAVSVARPAWLEPARPEVLPTWAAALPPALVRAVRGAKRLAICNPAAEYRVVITYESTGAAEVSSEHAGGDAAERAAAHAAHMNTYPGISAEVVRV